MVPDKGSNQPDFQNFINNPINNQSALNAFGDVDNTDYLGFDTNLYKYLNKNAISEMIKVNSEIKRILTKFKISVKINMGILNNLVRNHLPQTRNIAIGIANHLSKDYQQAINRKALSNATSLHDLAKVIIPDKILNKNGSLNDEEREIMQNHAVLSYEMLKSTDLDAETLNLIKNHHQNPQKTGYPSTDENFVSDINLQILSMADVYSALREKRSYKSEMSKEQALAIIKKEMEEGKFNIAVYNALVEYTTNEEISTKSHPQRQILNFKPVNSFSS